MGINERLKQLDLLEKKTRGSLPAKLKKFVPQSTVRTLLTSNHKPSFEVNAAVFKAYPRLNPVWYFYGEGEMFNYDFSTNVEEQATKAKSNVTYDIRSLATTIMEIQEKVDYIKQHLDIIEEKLNH